jgi:hypothetical protein
MNVALPLACQLSATNEIGKGMTVEAKADAAPKTLSAQIERINRPCIYIYRRLSACILTACSIGVWRDDAKRIESMSRRHNHVSIGFSLPP